MVDLHGSFFLETSPVASVSAGEAVSDAIPHGSMEAPMVLGGGGGCSTGFLRSLSWTLDLAVGLPKSKSNKSLDGFAFCCSSALNKWKNHDAVINCSGMTYNACFDFSNAIFSLMSSDLVLLSSCSASSRDMAKAN